jgi:hypothetical protein
MEGKKWPKIGREQKFVQKILPKISQREWLKSDEFSNVHTLCRRATNRKRDYDWLEHRALRPLVG